MTETRNRTHVDKILKPDSAPSAPAPEASSPLTVVEPKSKSKYSNGDRSPHSKAGPVSAVSSMQTRNLSLLLRFYIFALHGYFIEVNFTAIWNFIETRDFKMTGNSSLWSLLIYGTCGLVLEEMTYYFRKKSIPIFIRAVSYLMLCYFWEFSSGLILRHFNACPWDYSGFKYNLLGLITLEYAPFWLLSGLVCERILTGRFQQLHWIRYEISV